MKRNLAILVIFLGLVLVVNSLFILASLNVFSISEKNTYSKSSSKHLSPVIINSVGEVEEDISDQDFLFVSDELYITDYEDRRFGSIDISDESSSWGYLEYPRFNVYIDTNYYASNTPEIDNFFDDFEERFDFLESHTHWSSEKFYEKKLNIYVFGITDCYGGGGGFGDVVLRFSNPLYNESCLRSGGIGELGDKWPYMGVAIHEATHAINPGPIWYREWLAEGWARYNEYNVLALYGDISQGLADDYIYQGTNYYNWPDYVANDYHDTSLEQNEIQNSTGYTITAWMFSMLRDDYSLDWNEFYNILNNNLETLNKSWELGDEGYDSYYTDMHIIDLFGRALGHDDFEWIQNIFEYDPNGTTPPPGWGVRNWENLDWYADLVPELSFSNPHPNSGDKIDLIAIIHNYGGVSLNNVSVRFYNGEELLNEEIISVDDNGYNVISTEFTGDEGTHNIRVVVDEVNIKIESNDSNNEDSESIFFAPNYAPVLEPFDDVVVNEGEIVLIYPVVSDQNNDTLFYYIDSDLFVWNEDHFEWQTNQTSSGEYDFLVNVTDGELWDEQPVHVTVNDIIDSICGDANGDKTINLLDITYIINYLYKNGPGPVCEPSEACGDPDGSGAINILDVTRIINYLYKGGQPPVEKPGVCENL